jgi:hypothetical protein
MVIMENQLQDMVKPCAYELQSDLLKVPANTHATYKIERNIDLWQGQMIIPMMRSRNRSTTSQIAKVAKYNEHSVTTIPKKRTSSESRSAFTQRM